jgi:EAL domain-containing protein (putative c-di-GMP-specific phosphodiesterase class I)
LGNTSYRLAEDLLRDADTAMYRAKARGRARYEVFNPGMHQQAVALLQLENDIRRGLERQEFYLHYQPIIALRDSRLAGFEALLRWRHPERGEIMPKEFIPVAEETEQITALEHWAMHEACRCMKDWQERFSNARSLTMHVNLSGKHFDQDLIQELQTTLTETGLSASYLNLEITESMLMENADSAVSLLKQLKELGVGLSIDDFGTGYSSLSYLHRFPIDILKVDRSFVNKLDHDPEQLAIVRTIMTLAWNLGIEVVAEGVETNKQLAQVIALQCDYGQGFHYSEPLGEEAIEAILAGNAPESHVHYQLGR